MMNQHFDRGKTRSVFLNGLEVGGNSRITVQSMTTTSTLDYTKTIEQIHLLEKRGCDIIRVSVPNIQSAKVLHKIIENIKIPLIADIHFDYKLALESMVQGVAGLRLNPGNLRRKDKMPDIVDMAQKKKIPIRIGVNSGSIDFKKYSIVSPENLVQSALDDIHILENLNFYDIKISLKATDVMTTIHSYQLMAQKKNYPLHLGITEAGTIFSGSIKSAVGIGSLLAMGIGSTIRVSLSADPLEEVRLGKEILHSLNLLGEDKIEIISCPTCGRCEIDLIHIANSLEKEVGHLKKNIKVALMGCVVNGPGETKQADLGISASRGLGTLYKKGEKIESGIKEKDILNRLITEILAF